MLKKYRPYSDDNFQNGCLGLIQAAESYQPIKGVPFHNFACFCIERSIQLAFKKQQRLIENMVTEESYAGGMRFTDTPLMEGVCKNLINFDLKDIITGT